MRRHQNFFYQEVQFYLYYLKHEERGKKRKERAAIEPGFLGSQVNIITNRLRFLRQYLFMKVMGVFPDKENHQKQLMQLPKIISQNFLGMFSAYVLLCIFIKMWEVL